MVPRKIRAGGEEVLLLALIRRDAAPVRDVSFIKISFIYHRILLDPSKLENCPTKWPMFIVMFTLSVPTLR